jgi:hypothetical protein
MLFRFFATICLLSFLFGFLTEAAFARDGVPTYETGYKAIMKLGVDLHKALDPKFRNQIHSQPISLETDVTPFVRPVEYPDDSRPLRMVFISVGFVDLMNNVAHAKAINQVEKGYFERYVTSLSQENGDLSLRDLPRLTDSRFWNLDVMNEQLSTFNQMVGMVLAIDLSHHYLGHYKKYESSLSDERTKTVAINNLLTEKEWEDSVRVGMFNAIESGLGVEGVKALYEAIDKMPTRPTWTAYFLPSNVNVSKLLKTLEKYEKGYFKGQKFI